MCGATLEGWATNDIDIIITGKIDSYDRLEKILHNAMDIGFKNRQNTTLKISKTKKMRSSNKKKFYAVP